MKIEKFEIDVPQIAIDALRERLAATRWSPEIGNDDWCLGVNGSYLRELMDYWQNDFDWRTQEAEINRFPQFRAEINGVPIHFIHVRGKGTNPTPIVLNHGFPWTFWDFKHLIEPLADPAAHGGDAEDAFDVIVPSLPGFTFSTPLPRNDVGYIETAEMWVKLMRELGYERFVTQGGDAGAFISTRLGHQRAARTRAPGIYYRRSFELPHPSGSSRRCRRPVSDGGRPCNDQRAGQKPNGEYQRFGQRRRSADACLGDARQPGVAGAAWLLVRRRAWSDCGGDVETKFDKDTLLTHFSLYWFTNSFVSSEIFCRVSKFPEPMPLANDIKPEIIVSTAIAVMPKDLMHRSRKFVAAHTDLRQWTVMPGGAHFAPAEEPKLIVEDIRSFVRPLRQSRHRKKI